MRKGLAVLVLLVVVGLALVVVVTSRPELNETRDATETAWTPLVAPLTARYAALAVLVDRTDAALAAAGEDTIDQAGTKVALERWTEAAKSGDAKRMVGAANDLEARVGQLRAVLNASVRLGQTPDVAEARTAFDQTAVPAELVTTYNEAVRKYQRTRESTTRRLVAQVFGYGPIPTFEPSLVT
jgi:hypothetical protein